MKKAEKIDSRERIIVTLSADDIKTAEKNIKLLSSEVRWFEIGLPTYTSLGPDVIKLVHEYNSKVYLDLKYHDIPSTVARAVESAVNLCADMITIHATGGFEMMCRAVESAKNAAAKMKSSPKIYAVTVLTSMESLGDIGVQFEVREQVVRLAKLAKQCGLDGVISSPLEIKYVRSACGNKFDIIATGVRPAGSAALDQRRIASPAMAIAAGASHIVIGRPVTDAKDPLKVIRQIIEEIESVKAS